MGGIGRVGRVLVKKDSVLFFITVRTLWNEMQRSLMRTVGKEADLIKDEDHENRLLIIDESSVVSLHSENQKTDFQDVRLDDKYIICDPGGDTVNILTFETVESLTSDYADTLRRCHLAADFSEGVPAEDEREKKERDKLFSPVIDKCIEEFKPYFGRRSGGFRFLICNHDKSLKTHIGPISKGPIDKGDSHDGQYFKHMFLVLRDAKIVPSLKLYLPDGVANVTLVFIKKANDDIERTYLVGGFGMSPYLQKRIFKAFWVKGISFPNSQYKIGALITNYRGDSTVMRSAMIRATGVGRRGPVL
ncbi:hypothetical protein MFLAVUS_003572 [Mucor flavus]|uniref:Uncharacterized protein n=1 Tax=Mucor flavus TaxID=439312 RepID=A0ABP9YTF3_9FUNG